MARILDFFVKEAPFSVGYWFGMGSASESSGSAPINTGEENYWGDGSDGDFESS